MTHDPTLLLKVARLYYGDGVSKTDISHEIKASVTQVARLLKEARHRGIVVVDFRPPELEELGAALTERYSFLREAIVIPSHENYDFHLTMLGKAAAKFFDERVKAKARVGISGGGTLYEMINALPVQDRDIKMYPTAILGRGPSIEDHIDPTALLTFLWAKSGHREESVYYATVLPFQTGYTYKQIREDYDSFLKRDKIRVVYEAMQTVDFVFASIGPVGGPPESRKETRPAAVNLLRDLGITDEDLQSAGAIADLGYNFFDQNGKGRPEWEYFLALGVEHLHSMVLNPKKHVVAVAGRHKTAAIRAALRGGLVSVLVTDEITARELIEG